MKVNAILQGDALSVLRGFPEESIDCVVTSPPYWNLRDYSTEPLVWDGDPECEHEFIMTETEVKSNYNEGFNERCGGSPGQKKQEKSQQIKISRGFCSLCGCWKGSLGLEPTPDLFIQHLCSIFDEVKRVLKKTGSCYVNIGDSYSANRTYQTQGTKQTKESQPHIGMNSKEIGVKPKSLVGIPYRFALEMMNRGWILRQEIIWHKPNAMPSSVKDRFTVDFEPVFFFAKSGKYYFEQQFEPHLSENLEYKMKDPTKWGHKKTKTCKSNVEKYREETHAYYPQGRNKRCVWTISTSPCKEAHFATFPEDLVKTPILASCPPGGIVLDCFSGAGTTLLVAEKLGRKWIGIELNPEYIKIAWNREVKYVE